MHVWHVWLQRRRPEFATCYRPAANISLYSVSLILTKLLNLNHALIIIYLPLSNLNHNIVSIHKYWRNLKMLALDIKIVLLNKIACCGCSCLVIAYVVRRVRNS